MNLYLINPSNPLVGIVNVSSSRWNRYRVWKPLSLTVLAGLTPPGWKIKIVDENLIGLDVDEPGIGQQIAAVASQYGLDNLNTLFLTPLPGTRLWDQMKSEERIALDAFPEDWKYDTLTFPVAQYKRLSLDGIIGEMVSCNRSFYSLPRILGRVRSSLWQRRQPLIGLVGNLSYRSNIRVDRAAYANFKRHRRDSFPSQPNATTPTPEQI